ncbi:MAG: hypothetical protein NTW46_02030 [Candidatus Nealsonbacteria bacterium]|nr:hypothetical protein [Candidatus Nealsonbacteria bacterium]
MLDEFDFDLEPAFNEEFETAGDLLDENINFESETENQAQVIIESLEQTEQPKIIEEPVQQKESEIKDEVLPENTIAPEQVLESAPVPASEQISEPIPELISEPVY